MTGQRITVGVDGSPAAQLALEWAVQEAIRRRATVLVVTAWPRGVTSTRPARGEQLMAERERLDQMQRAAIERARVAVPRGGSVVIGREIIIADPVAALYHTATMADLVVVGCDPWIGLAPRSVAGRLAGRLAQRSGRRRTMLVVVPDQVSASELVWQAEAAKARVPEPV